MSDIQTSMNRILLPDISTEPVADRPAVDSGFDLGQADVPPVLPLAFPAPLAANLAANLAAKPAKADPLAQWLEQTLGISAQFTPPAAVQADDPVPTSPPVDAETAQSDALIRPMPLISAPRVQASPIHGAAIRDDDAPNRAQPPIAPTVDPQATTRIASSALGHGDLMAVDAQPPLDAVTAVPAHQQSSTAATPPASNAAQDVAIIAQPVQPDMGASAQARPADFVSLTAIPAVPTRIKVATTVDDAAKPPVVPTPADGLTAHRATDASKQTWPVATDADAAPMPARQPDAPAEPDQPLNISASAPQPPRPDAQNLQMTSIPDAVPDTALRADLPLGARDIAMTTSPTAHAAPAQTDPRPDAQNLQMTSIPDAVP
ncbi:MAG: hypothetical protein L0G27_04710, partial [Paracoccus sp. (in: a-proteobacteria)]|nr:hypothetical protein [Paracoccus sp. (in: a-proteobacteria)]